MTIATLIILTVAVLLILLLYMNYRRQIAVQTQFSLQHSLFSRSFIVSLIKGLLFLLVWIFLAAAYNLSKPYTIGPPGAPKNDQKPITGDVIILLDATRSMAVKDARNGHSRFFEAKEVAEAIVKNLTYDKVALYTFAEGLTRIAPLTNDLLFVRMMIHDAKIDVDEQGGSELQPLFHELLQRHLKEHSDHATTFILLTDGEDTSLADLDQAQKNAKIESIKNGLKKNFKDNVHLITIAVGSKNGGVIPDLMWNGQQVISQPNPELLNALSNAANGKHFYSAATSSNTLAKQVNSQIRAWQTPDGEQNTQKEQEINSSINKVEKFNWYIALAVISLLFYIYLPESQMWYREKIKNLLSKWLPAACFLLLLPFSLHSTTKQDFLIKGIEANNSGNYEAAIIAWEKLFNQPLNSEELNIILYDIATAQLSAGQLQDAIQTYSLIDFAVDAPKWRLRRLHANTALAYFLFAKETLLQNNNVDALTALTYAKASLALAIKNACQSGQMCAEAIDLQALQKEIDKLSMSLNDNNITQTAIITTQPLLFLQKYRLKESINGYFLKKHLLAALSWQMLAFEDTKKNHALPEERRHLELWQSITKAQKRALAAANEFNDGVLEIQQQNYQHLAKDGNCQTQPWEAVLPYFNQGIFYAEQALKKISEKNYSIIIPLQQMSLIRWIQAWNRMMTADVNVPPSCSSSKTDINEENNNSANSAVMLLQQMNMQDKMPNRKIPLPQNKVKPW